MKILLINPPIREWAKPNCFPSGLGYIASSLLNAGHKVDVMDINAHRWSKEEVEQKIKNVSFDLIGVSGIITQYRYIKWLTSIIRRHHPDKKIMVGGTCGTSIPKIVLENTAADIICIDEGEITCVELANTLEKGESLDKVLGIWFKNKKNQIISNLPRPPIENLESIPFPSWDLFPMDIYLKNPIGAPNVGKWIDGGGATDIKTMNLIGTRGCPYRCKFCYHNFMGKRYRFRSAESVFKEIVHLKENYGAQYFHFNDDCFIINRQNVLKFCDLLLKSKTNIQWGCAGRVNLMNEELISKMKESGCTLIGYGIESGSQKILDAMNKMVKVEQAKEAILLTQKYLGWADCSFMIGYPGETRETIRETVAFCKELNLAPEVIFFATPYPGTELYEIAKEMGKITPENEEEHILGLGEQGEKIRVNFTDFSDEELKNLKEGMVQELGAWNKIQHEKD